MTSADTVSPTNHSTENDDSTQPKNDELSGIIYPPADIRKMVDTTSNAVAKNGIQFEIMLKDNNKANSKLSFLYPSDPYHSYYQHMVAKFRAGEEIIEKPEVAAPEVKPAPAPVEEKLPPKRPPPFEFMNDLPPISAQDLDILKLTAQFVARNGRPFLHTISAKEQRNFQFDFLKPTHSLFNYFMKLVEQYSNVIKPPTKLLEKLKINSDESFRILDRVNERVEFTRYEDEVRKKQAEKEEKDRALYASIDWHDFVVVQTLEFTDEDNDVQFPIPTTLKELESMTLAQKKSAIINEIVPTTENQVDDMEVDMEDDFDQPPPPREEQIKIPDYSGPIKVKKDYVPKVKQTAAIPEATQICPYCNQPIPVSEIDNHIKIELLDPKHQKQREIYEARKSTTNLVNSSADWTRNLGRLAERRPDIFDTPEEIASSKLKEDEDRRRRLEKERHIWDGHSQTLPTGANPNLKHGPGSHNLDDQIDAIHRKAGLTGPESNVGPHFMPPHGMPPADYHMHHPDYPHPPPPHYMPPPPPGYGHPPPPPHQPYAPYPPHLQQPPAPPEQDPNQKKQRKS